ncbi:hepatocyte growth factor activator isoform X3 [Hemicordylus capensis]|uniref:hepatocyte growth factor activator isoform X3 n=1 Tax=Hemicordylus capensis TaxID=884348 RepID=UPI002304B102|nr:hepatocyte growth factor activator isoform X3 [Hemicordylus capensis]
MSQEQLNLKFITSEILCVCFPLSVFTQDGQECRFPFRYGGTIHYSCISNTFSQRRWCSTTHNFDREGKWGYCVTSSEKSLNISDYCVSHPCRNGGTCFIEHDQHSYHCMCPEGFMERNCKVAKCFDESLYEYFATGESWARIFQGTVQQCACVNSIIECQPAQYRGCTVNPCLHGSSCRQIVSTGKTVCGCKQPFVGQYCNIVPSHLCYSGNGTDYRGITKKTASGDRCLLWNSVFLDQEVHANTLERSLQLGLGPYSYCRNPDGDDKPWCYIVKNNIISWEYCNITRCQDRSRRPPIPEPEFAVHAEDTRRNSCGRRHKKRNFLRPRIVGGSFALPGSFPWLAAIYIGNAFCGGSLIRSCWVMAAAHCFANSPLKSTIRVVLGQHFFNKTTDVTQEFEVENYIMFPSFTVYKPHENDIVLVKLKKTNKHCARRSQFVRTICLPENGMSFPDGYKCQIAGWGHMQESKLDVSGYSKVLQETFVPIIPDYKCQNSDVYGVEFTENMFCAGYLDGKSDACQGDSGGPLACEKDGITYVYGIVSWGEGCGQPGKPGVYTKVSKYVDWINAKTQPTPKAES